MTQFFAYLLFQILKNALFILIIILKETIYIKTITQIDKHKVKDIVTACIPKITINNFYFHIKNLQLYKKNFFTTQL